MSEKPADASMIYDNDETVVTVVQWSSGRKEAILIRKIHFVDPHHPLAKTPWIVQRNSRPDLYEHVMLGGMLWFASREEAQDLVDTWLDLALGGREEWQIRK